MCWACSSEKEAYTIPATGFVTLWPFKKLGQSKLAALIKTSATLAPTVDRWAVVSDKGIRKRIDVRGRQQARAKALDILKGDPGVLARFVTGSPNGDIYEMTETLVHMGIVEAAGVSNAEMVGINGIAIEKAGSPYSAIDLRVLTKRLSSTLIGHEQKAMRPVIKKYLEKLDGVDWTNGAQVDRALRNARDMLQKVAPGKVLPGWSKKVQISVEDVATKTKRVLSDTYLPSLSTALDQPDLMSARRIATQGGWFLRDELGQRSTNLTVKGREIVRQGLAQGLGKEEIAKRMREQLPDLWKAYGKQYATTTASVAVSRARSFTEVQSYASVGIEYLEVQAVLDERTTEICRALDGTIVEVQAAKALLDNAGSVSAPEDIYTESPFMRVRTDQKTGDRNIMTNNGDKVARVMQSGMGKVDDRGRHEFHLAGKDLNNANIGVPPYHHLCRSWTIPRSDVRQVPVNYAARSVAPAVHPFDSRLGRRVPSGSTATGRVPIEMFKAPTPGNPVIAGSRLPIDDYLLPKFKDITPALRQRLMDRAEEDAFAYRASHHDYTDQAFATQGSASILAPQKAVDLNMMFKSQGHDIVSELFIKGNRGNSIASVLSNPSIRGRDTLFRITDASGGGVEWLRARMLNTPGLDRAVERYRKALTSGASKVEVAAAAEALIEVGKAKGWLIRSKDLTDVATGQAARVRSVSAGVPAKAKPKKKPKPKPKERQPDTIEQPAPVKPKPKADVVSGSLADVPVHSGVYAARPDPQAMVGAAWDDTLGLVSTMSVEKSGKLAAQSEWKKITEASSLAQRGVSLPDVGTISLKASDKVVSMFVPHEVERAHHWGSVYEEIAHLEVNSKSVITRDWILQDGRGMARFVRVDGKKLAAAAKKHVDFEDWLETATITENYAGLKEAGVDVFTELKKFYPKAEVDWGTRNLLPGVGIEEQVLARTAAVKAEITERLEALGPKRSIPGYVGKEIQAALKQTAGKGSFAEGARASKKVVELEGMNPRQVNHKARSVLDREDRTTKTTFATNDDIKFFYDEATEYAGDGLRAALHSKALPDVIITGSDATRAFCRARGTTSETSTIVMSHELGDLKSFQRAGVNDKAAQEWRRTFSHEFQHHADGVGFNSQAAKVGLSEATIDGTAINIYGHSRPSKMEVAVRARVVDPYDAKVYRDDRRKFIRSASSQIRFTKEKTMKILKERRELTYYKVGSSDTEFMTMARERLHKAEEVGKMWATNPDQVALLVSMQRGHYTPY